MNLATVKDTQCKSGKDFKVRKCIYGNTPEVFTHFYDEETNIVIWQRKLSSEIQNCVREFLNSNPFFQLSMTATPEKVLSNLKSELKQEGSTELSSDIAELVDMFCCLFEIKVIGLRLTALNEAMCPKFHVDRVPGRLVATYQGKATEWLPHEVIDRSKLGAGCNGLPDHESGLYQDMSDIQQLNCGDVSLLKGELWEGNENAGLVHRSPELPAGDYRLLLTLDFIN